MSAVLEAGAEAAVLTGLLEMLRDDAEVRAVFGDPPRVFDDETERAAFPFAQVEKHETAPAGASGVSAIEHKITIGVLTRYDGLIGAKAAIGALRAAVERTALNVIGQHVVLSHTVYADVMRRRDRRAFRGVVRIRIITEEIV